MRFSIATVILLVTAAAVLVRLLSWWNAEPKYCYKQRVAIVSGFYSGATGTVEKLSTIKGLEYRYLVAIDGPDSEFGFIKESDLIGGSKAAVPASQGQGTSLDSDRRWNWER